LTVHLSQLALPAPVGEGAALDEAVAVEEALLVDDEAVAVLMDALVLVEVAAELTHRLLVPVG
jgi:uncharacterized Rossmann fold enzyme